MLISVAPDKLSTGIEAPLFAGHTYDWRAGLNSSANTRRVRPRYVTYDLSQALGATYRTDAHLVTYIVRSPHGTPVTAAAEEVPRHLPNLPSDPRLPAQPRVNKSGLEWLTGEGYSVTVETFFADVDNPAHGAWTPELLEEAYALDSQLNTAGVYYTAHGRRIVQPLATPIPAALSEPYLLAWLLSLDAQGFAVDFSCKDWTRNYRLPNVKRSGLPYRSPRLDLSRMAPIPPPIPVEDPQPYQGAQRRRSAQPVNWTAEPPEAFAAMIADLAAALTRTPATSNWHEIFMQLAGALLSAQVPPEHVPVLCLAVSQATRSDSRQADRLRSAQDTVRRWCSGLPVANKLPSDLAGIVRANRPVPQPSNEPEPPPLADALAGLRHVLSHAPDGLTVIQAACGLGKTRAAEEVAVERAGKGVARAPDNPDAPDRPDTPSRRAPLQSKTAISVDKNALAIQVAADLRRLWPHGTPPPVRRVFGPLSLTNPDGSPVCHYADVAKPLVNGGQSIRAVLCAECEHQPDCPAYAASEGPEDARIIVGPHALLGQLDSAAGSTGLLVIDEPPELLTTTRLTLDALLATQANLSRFDATYAAAMSPVLEAVAQALQTVPIDTVFSPQTFVSPFDPSPLALLSPDAPPISRFSLYQARHSVALAKELGAASRTLMNLHRALTTTSPTAVRVEEIGASRVLLITAPSPTLAAALSREGAVVVTAADANVHLPVLAKAVGYAPQFHKFAARDGAPISRAMIKTKANRTEWTSGGRLIVKAGLARALQSIVAWLSEDGFLTTRRQVGLISTKAISRTIWLVLRAELGEAVSAVPSATSPARVTGHADYPKGRVDSLDEARAILWPALSPLFAFPVSLSLGHYYAQRGLDHLSQADALVTLSDPWPNIGQERHDVAFLQAHYELTSAVNERLTEKAAAELEQAHGRLRTIHRTRTARALHVGHVTPAGHGWTMATVTHPQGRRRNASNMSADELRRAVNRLGGVAETARRLSIGRSSLARYLSGKRGVPAALALVLREEAGTEGREASEAEDFDLEWDG